MFTKEALLLLAAVASIVSGGYALIEYGEKIGGVRYENQELKANLEKERKENLKLRSEVERLEGLKQNSQQSLEALRTTRSQPDKEGGQNQDTVTKSRKNYLHL